MFKLYLFTFSFVSFLGTYPTLDQCIEQARKIQNDYHYKIIKDFTLYCVNPQKKDENFILENEKANFPKGTGKLL